VVKRELDDYYMFVLKNGGKRQWKLAGGKSSLKEQRSKAKK
jgi:ribosomal protein L16 Arg81 hydroxylase